MADKSGADGGLRELALFAGAGGGILGGKLLGWRTVCAVEREPYVASVLAQRQNDGILPAFPIWDDVRTFDGRPWRGIVDVVSGGFPCQDISAAGKGAGIDGERSGLWMEMARIIGEVRPNFAFVENSPILTSRGLGRVLGDLAEMGFDARWGVLAASDVGAPHLRQRIWIVANACRAGRQQDARSAHGDESQNERWSAAQADKPASNGERSGARPMAYAMRERLFSCAQTGIYRGEARAGSRDEQPERRGCASENVSDTDSHKHQSEPHARSGQWQASGSAELPCHTNGTGLAQWKGQRCGHEAELAATLGADWWAVEPDLGGKVDGLA